MSDDRDMAKILIKLLLSTTLQNQAKTTLEN